MLAYVNHITAASGNPHRESQAAGVGIITHTATTAYPNLRPSYFSSRWIALPPASEQTAIATVLSEMDTELTALERRRDKTRAVKLGMMQELLTGRTRLI